MTLDPKLRSQLIEAHENIGAQLEQLEGTSRGRGDCRAVYADLQRELQEIEALLNADGGDDVEAELGYQPIVKWYSDGTAGNPVRTTRAGVILGIAMVGALALYMIDALFRAIVG